MEKLRIWTIALCAAIGTALATPALAETAETDAIDDVLAVLRERGIIDEAQHAEIAGKNRAYREEQTSILDRIEWSGDLRARFENFWFDDGPFDDNRPDRTRGRYRLRLKAKARVNDYVDAVMRFTSGENIALGDADTRSSNRTLGRGNDFARDAFFIDQAYIDLKAPTSWVGEGGKLHVMLGKTANPFRWKNTRDYLLWDSDISPEGAAIQYERELTSNAQMFVNAGYFIANENSRGSDPHVTGFQIGATGTVAEDVEIGGRVSYYDWRSLDNTFLLRGAANGNVPSANRSRFSVLELAGYVSYSGIEDWPIRLFGHIARNFNALDSPGIGKEDTGWLVAIEAGDKKKFATLGFGFTRQEANFWPAQFTDSDYLDGRTNRRGWILYGSRQILHNTDVNVTIFGSEPVRRTAGLFEGSLSQSDRIRLQADLVVKF